MPRIRLGLPLLAVAMLAGCVSGGGRISSSGNEALSPEERRLQAAESRLAELSRRLDSVNLTGMDQDSQRVRDDLRTLRGEMERLRYDYDQAQKRARDQYLDLDRRLQRVESAGASGAAPATGFAPAAPMTAPTVPASSGGVAPVLAPAPSGGPVIISQGGGGSAEEEGAYLTAFDSLKNGKYDDAIRGFRAVVEKWPNGRYTDNALYWTGESYYVKRDYRSALTAFQAVLTRFPSSAKAADAMLKVGLTQIELKQEAEGRASLQKVIQTYPQSNAARLAQQRLEPPKSGN